MEIEFHFRRKHFESLSSSLEIKESELIHINAELKEVKEMKSDFETKLEKSDKMITEYADKR